MKSIVQDEKKCYFCDRTVGLHNHHIYFGTALRPISERNGFVVWLCPYHHENNKYGVHGNRSLDLILKRKCQEIYEAKGHTREEWLSLIGRSYLESEE